jgi:tetratricopeptide (TPR) repeat protein
MLNPTVYLAPRHAAFLALLVAACAPYPQRVHQEPVIAQGERIPAAEAAPAAPALDADRRAMRGTLDSIHALATADCGAEACAAIARGELLVGMSEVQVYAATKSVPAAWVVRRSGANAVMVPYTPESAPRDRVGELVMVQLDAGRAAVVSRRGPQGIQVASRTLGSDATARNRATAAALILEGDDLVASNDLDGALNRYDRASVLDPEHAEVQYKAARLLDLQLRPQEALMRYQRFLLSMDIERIRARGEANAKLAEAITLAQQRIVILEKQVK